MSSNVGLATPRGSGTSGYVQRNLSALKPRHTRDAPYSKDVDTLRHKQRQPDPEILEHDRLKAIEVKVFDLRDRLESEGVDEEEIEEQTDALRAKLEAAKDDSSSTEKVRGLKSHQVHELAQAKIKQTERLRQALKIDKDYEEGSHWRKQEERMRENLANPERARDRG